MDTPVPVWRARMIVADCIDSIHDPQLRSRARSAVSRHLVGEILRRHNDRDIINLWDVMRWLWHAFNVYRLWPELRDDGLNDEDFRAWGHHSRPPDSSW